MMGFDGVVVVWLVGAGLKPAPTCVCEGAVGWWGGHEGSPLRGGCGWVGRDATRGL